MAKVEFLCNAQEAPSGLLVYAELHSSPFRDRGNIQYLPLARIYPPYRNRGTEKKEWWGKYSLCEFLSYKKVGENVENGTELTTVREIQSPFFFVLYIQLIIFSKWNNVPQSAWAIIS